MATRTRRAHAIIKVGLVEFTFPARNRVATEPGNFGNLLDPP
jgi:hypothetical protein